MISILEVTTPATISNPTLRELAERAKNGRSRTFIAKNDECEVGFLCYDDWSDQSNGFIYEVIVLPEHRRQGIGSSLLSFSETLARSLRCTSIRLEPNTFDRTVDLSWLVSWYMKQGYAPMLNDPKKLEKIF